MLSVLGSMVPALAFRCSQHLKAMAALFNFLLHILTLETLFCKLYILFIKAFLSFIIGWSCFPLNQDRSIFISKYFPSYTFMNDLFNITFNFYSIKQGHNNFFFFKYRHFFSKPKKQIHIKFFYWFCIY